MTMALNNLRVGYVPCSCDLLQPGDRRRFAYYALKRNIKFEIAHPSGKYDLVIVTERGDKSVWSKYRNAKIVYDFVDSYLAISRCDPKGLLRGLAKYCAGESRHLELNYWKAIEGMCSRADAVLCSTEEQKQNILKLCKNVHIVLDFHNSVVRNVKTDYTCGSVFNFVWEGLPCNIGSLFEIREVLARLKEKYKIALHVVTDLYYYQYMGRYLRRDTSNLTRRLFDNVHLHAWEEKTCSSIISGCDMAVIPIPLNNPLAAGKPENKLLLFWRMGMPVIVSATPAYSRAMQSCGLPMACRTQEEWLGTLEKYINNKQARGSAGQLGRVYAEDNYSEEKILARWDNVFKSIV